MTNTLFGRLMIALTVASSVITLVVFLLLFSNMREELEQDKAENELLLKIIEGVDRCAKV